MQNIAPAIKDYRYDFAKRQFIHAPTGQRFNPSYAAFDAALGENQRDAAGIGADSGRAAIVIQSLISEDGRGVGDGGILQAVLDHSGSLIEGGMRGMFSLPRLATFMPDETKIDDYVRAVQDKHIDPKSQGTAPATPSAQTPASPIASVEIELQRLLDEEKPQR